MENAEPSTQNQSLIPDREEDSFGAFDSYEHDVTAYLSITDTNRNVQNITSTGTSNGFRGSKLSRMNQPNRFPVHHRTQEGKTGFDEFKGFAERGHTIRYCMLLFLLYFAIGTLVYSFCFDKWSIQDSMYFTVVTFTTCGYGDLTPDTPAEYVFTAFFLLFGVLVLATVAFGIVFEHIFEAYDEILEKAKAKTDTKFMKQFDSSRTTGSAEPEQKSMMKDFCKSFVGVLPLYILLVLGALLIGNQEHWEVSKSLYFMVVTASTVGYGDFSPSTESMRLFCVFYIPFAVGVTAELFGRITGVYVTYMKEEAENEFLNSRLTLADIDRMDRNGDGVVAKEEFMRFFLVSMGKISHDELDRLELLFTKLDASHDGQLSIDDLVGMSTRPAPQAQSS
mmetsp:Transcript_14169/g.21268  ORF Transcript_14169/g.21268 Transcript_14169/m.21268 type:complete len:393 (+) Transcript_14169:24-1202(+)